MLSEFSLLSGAKEFEGCNMVQRRYIAYNASYFPCFTRGVNWIFRAFCRSWTKNLVYYSIKTYFLYFYKILPNRFRKLLYENKKWLRVCLVTIFSPYFIFPKILFYFIFETKELACMATKNGQNKKCFQNSIYEEN